jgi:RHH-type proline utilization regulon transcriptional repressor/proline dehydrogenase/delta 1-pyrroline-5-carboxylate dehydrogenase
LRILAVQDDIADALIAMLMGAMKTLRLGNPADPEPDIGPVIHEKARDHLLAHLREARAYGRELFDAGQVALPDHGSFFAPRLIEIDRISSLTHEVFGPVLHVVRWRAGGLEALIGEINATGYGLTLALETRIAHTIETVRRLARVGNLYVNRSQIGAVVGTQPFGGEGLSGTGPKAGGPHYLMRFVSERVTTINTAATGGNIRLLRED